MSSSLLHRGAPSVLTPLPPFFLSLCLFFFLLFAAPPLQSCRLFGSGHIEGFGINVTCKNIGDDCGFIPLLQSSFFSIDVLNKAINSFSARAERVRISLGSEGEASFIIVAEEFMPTEGFTIGAGLAEATVTPLSTVDLLVQIPKAAVTIRIVRLSTDEVRGDGGVRIDVCTFSFVYSCLDSMPRLPSLFSPSRALT